MQKSLKTNNKEEDEWLEIWLNFVLFLEDTRLEDTPQYDNRSRAIMQTFVEEVLHLISEKNTVWMYINIVFFRFTADKFLLFNRLQAQLQLDFFI